MNASLNIHHIKSIKVEQPEDNTLDDGRTFVSQKIILTDNENKDFTIYIFNDECIEVKNEKN